MVKKAKKKIESWLKKNADCCEETNGSCNGAGYFLAFLGAAIYYVGAATSFGAGVVGFLKAVVWPLFLVLEVLQYIHG